MSDLPGRVPSPPRRTWSPPGRARSPPGRAWSLTMLPVTKAEKTEYVRRFIDRYGHTDDKDARELLLIKFNELAREVPSGLQLGLIDDRFIDGNKILHIPPTMTIVADYFFYGSTLMTVNLSPLGGVTHIGKRFLSLCSSLERVDLRPLRQLRMMGRVS